MTLLLVEMRRKAWDFEELHQAGRQEYDAGVIENFQAELRTLKHTLHEFLNSTPE